VILSANERRTAERLGEDYWMYVVYDCATNPQLKTILDPARLDWQAVQIIEHYRLGADAILKAAGTGKP
jgi:hypothetical protein